MRGVETARRVAAGSRLPRAMARYNAWMNERLYEACSHVSDADRKRDHRGQVTTLLMQLGTDPGGHGSAHAAGASNVLSAAAAAGTSFRGRTRSEAKAIDEQREHPACLSHFPFARRCGQPQSRKQQLASVDPAANLAGRGGGVQQAA